MGCCVLCFSLACETCIWCYAAWSFLALETCRDALNTKCFQVSNQMRQYCRDIYDPNIGRLPKKAGTQNDWMQIGRALRHGCQGKRRERRKPKAIPWLVQRCYQWCWRRSVGSVRPNLFLKELAKLFSRKDRWDGKNSNFGRGHFGFIWMKVLIPMRRMSLGANFTGPPAALFPSS